MPIREELEGLSALARRRLKARRLAEHAAARLPISWRLGAGARAAEITVSAASYDGEALRLVVSATRAGRTMTDEVVIVNPPIMTPTGRQAPNPDPEGPPMINEYREDAIGAIRSVVEDVVREWERVGVGESGSGGGTIGGRVGLVGGER